VLSFYSRGAEHVISAAIAVAAALQPLARQPRFVNSYPVA